MMTLGFVSNKGEKRRAERLAEVSLGSHVNELELEVRLKPLRRVEAVNVACLIMSEHSPDIKQVEILDGL